MPCSFATGILPEGSLFFKNLNIKKNNTHHFYMQGVVYSVNAKSFQDSDNNGYGDLKGKGDASKFVVEWCFKYYF